MIRKLALAGLLLGLGLPTGCVHANDDGAGTRDTGFFNAADNQVCGGGPDGPIQVYQTDRVLIRLALGALEPCPAEHGRQNDECDELAHGESSP